MNKETGKKLVNEEGKFPFSNSDIEKWVPTYGDSKDKFKELPLNVPRDSHLKGLHIRHSRSSRKKDFILMFWHNKKPDRDKDIDALMSDEKEEVSKDFKEDPSLSKYPSWLKEKGENAWIPRAIKWGSKWILEIACNKRAKEMVGKITKKG